MFVEEVHTGLDGVQWQQVCRFALRCFLCSDVPCGVSTQAVDGYLSIFIIHNEQKQEGKDERRRYGDRGHGQGCFSGSNVSYVSFFFCHCFRVTVRKAEPESELLLGDESSSV